MMELQRMGVEEFLTAETTVIPSTINSNLGANPRMKYMIVGGLAVLSIGVGLYMANQFAQNRKQNFKNNGEKENQSSSGK